MSKITFVKKILENGSPCKKCAEVISKLEASGYINKIDETIIAIENNPTSAGMQLAQKHNVDRAPFFLIESDNGDTRVITSYGEFTQIAFGLQRDAKEELLEFMNNNSGLDFL